jgi:protein gp37
MSTKIEWTDRTWNPLAGCTVISPGCTHCYAMRMAHRLEAMGQQKYQGTIWKTDGGKILWTGRINLDEKALLEPLKWKKPQRVFVNSMSDLFHENVPFEYIDKVFAVMAITPHITYQVLTKRPERMWQFMAWKKNDWVSTGMDEFKVGFKFTHYQIPVPGEHPNWKGLDWPLPNVWLGVTVENQEQADKRIPLLLQVPAAVRFLSCEPLLGPIEFFNHSNKWELGESRMHLLRGFTVTNTPEGLKGNGRLVDPQINWVIAGGESGHNARPVHPDWIRSLRDQCRPAWVPFFFKQWGEGIPMGQKRADGKIQGFTSFKPIDEFTGCVKVGTKAAGSMLDGMEWKEFPETGGNEGKR